MPNQLTPQQALSMVSPPGFPASLPGFPPPPAPAPIPGGLQFKDAAPMICTVVDNGVPEDDPRVMVRLNEATKIIMDYMIPVGGMATANVTSFERFIVLPIQMENAIEAHPLLPATTVRGGTDITQSWYEIVNNSMYVDPNQAHDMPMIDQGLWPADVFWGSAFIGKLARVYLYPGLDPQDAVVTVTGVKRFLPVESDRDYLIVQNIEAIKLVIMSIERNENGNPQEGAALRQQAFEQLQAEVKKHLLDPRNYMLRKSNYQDDTINFPANTLGYVRANIALDIDDAMKTGKIDLTWSINQVERRIMTCGKIYKDMVIPVTAEVVGGIVYLPINVANVLAVDLDGSPIPIRGEFFQYLENGPGFFPSYNMLIDQGDEMLPSTQSVRRKYKLIADCTNLRQLNTVCLLRWLLKNPEDYMVIKNYEAIRLLMTAKFLEEKEDWKNAQANEMKAFQILDQELDTFLKGIRHTVHVQTDGFGMGDVGQWMM